MKIADFRLPLHVVPLLSLRKASLCVPIVLCLTAAHAFGFEATLKINPPVVSLNDSAQLSIEVRGARSPQPPAISEVPGLQISYGGQSTQMNWVNGKTDNFVSFNYTVYPQKTGDFSIGPITYKVGKDTQVLGPATLKVVGSSDGTQQAQNWSDVLFAKLTADRNSAYVQEPFELTLAIYSRQDLQMAGNINLEGLPESGLPDLKWQELEPTRDVVNNMVFDVRRFRARTRALSSGSFAFKPVITAQVALQNRSNRRRSFFDDPFFNPLFSQVETRPVQVPIEPFDLEIKPLPVEGRPAGFSGAVGQFRFQVSAKPVSVHPGDPITLTMSIAGDGNFDRITAPVLRTDDGFRFYGDPTKAQTNNLVAFEQVVSPKSTDVTEIPPVAFSYFDTSSGEYRILHSESIPLTVTAGSTDTAQVFATKETVVLPPQDTPFATESDIQRMLAALKGFWMMARPWLWIIPCAFGLWIIVFFSRKIHHHRRKDTARVRRQKAPKAARKALHAATQARRHEKVPEFYDALWTALTDYFCNRLNLSPGDITSSVVLRTLERAGFSTDQMRTLQTVFDRVEAGRYGAPQTAPTAAAMEETQRSLEQILRLCEKSRI
ncbi:MAG: BatD family protein [Kiritimatiellales bacterium]